MSVSSEELVEDLSGISLRMRDYVKQIWKIPDSPEYTTNKTPVVPRGLRLHGDNVKVVLKIEYRVSFRVEKRKDLD